MQKNVEMTPQIEQVLRSGKVLYSCEVCGKVLSTKGNLKSHGYIHTGNKPFKCMFPNCEKSFSSKIREMTHSRTHVGTKPYICEVCGKNFNEKGNLKTHQRIHTGEKPFKCELCGKSFKAKGQLSDHNNIHLNIKKFQCKTCLKSFSRNYILKNHLRVHTGEKPYVCQMVGCKQTFSGKSNRNTHYRRHILQMKIPQNGNIEKRSDQNLKAAEGVGHAVNNNMLDYPNLNKDYYYTQRNEEDIAEEIINLLKIHQEFAKNGSNDYVYNLNSV